MDSARFHYQDMIRACFHDFDLRFCLRCIGLGLIIAMAPVVTSAQKDNCSSNIRHSLHQAYYKADLLVALSDLSWRPGLCLAGAQVRKNRSISIHLSLSAHHTYSFVGASNHQTTDIDIYIRDTSQTIVAQDNAFDESPIVQFTPTIEGVYTVQIHVVEALQDTVSLALAILRSAGNDLDKGQFHHTLQSLFTTRQTLASQHPDFSWPTKNGQLSVWGFSLPTQSNTSLSLPHSIHHRLIFGQTSAKSDKVRLIMTPGDSPSNHVASELSSTPIILHQENTHDSRPELFMEVHAKKLHTILLVGQLSQLK